MPFNLFRKKKQPEQQENIVVTPQEEPQAQAPVQPTEEATETQEKTIEEHIMPPEEPAQQIAPQVIEEQQQAQTPEPQQAPVEEKPAPAPQTKTYLKAMPLRDLSDLETVKSEIQNGNIVILKVTPLANKSIEDVKSAVNDLYQFAENVGGDIARLGEERVVICPKSVRIWREKTPTSVSNVPSGQLPTAA